MSISKAKIYGYQLIGTRAHGMLDYIVGAFLAASPWLLGFYSKGPETWIPFALGISTILYSLLTDYELGIIKKISMSLHLTLDLMGAVFLGISPWACNFADQVWIPHVAVAAVEIVVVLMSQQKFEHDESVDELREGRP